VDVFLLVLTLVLFYALHSLLAWTAVKQWAARYLGLERWYRLTYSLVSTVLLIAAVIAYIRVPQGPQYFDHGLVRLAGWAMMVVGALLATIAVLRFGGAGFLGLVPELPTGLVRQGLHAHVRHPIYSGIILACAGWILVSPTPATLVTVAVTLIYLPIGIHLEERKLIATFGEDYLRYRREVPAILPHFN
jgi:protein-S-isoprenylcysteine O-methyltransferase Ste14